MRIRSEFLELDSKTGLTIVDLANFGIEFFLGWA